MFRLCLLATIIAGSLHASATPPRPGKQCPRHAENITTCSADNQLLVCQYCNPKTCYWIATSETCEPKSNPSEDQNLATTTNTEEIP